MSQAPKPKPKHLYTAFLIPILLAISAIPALAAPADTIWTKASEIMKMSMGRSSRSPPSRLS